MTTNHTPTARMPQVEAALSWAYAHGYWPGSSADTYCKLWPAQEYVAATGCEIVMTGRSADTLDFDDISPSFAGLEDLLAAMRQADPALGNTTDLPVFGGAGPDDTTGVWSWDEGRLIVGTCSDDFRIVSRTEYAEEQADWRAAHPLSYSRGR